MKEQFTRLQKLELYTDMVTAIPDKVKGDTIPYTSVNGHMYSMLTKGDDIGLRLPDDIRATFIEQYAARLITQYGVVQKEYIAVPEELFTQPEELQRYFKISFDHISRKKPKPAKKAKRTE